MGHRYDVEFRRQAVCPALTRDLPKFLNQTSSGTGPVGEARNKFRRVCTINHVINGCHATNNQFIRGMLTWRIPLPNLFQLTWRPAPNGAGKSLRFMAA